MRAHQARKAIKGYRDRLGIRADRDWPGQPALKVSKGQLGLRDKNPSGYRVGEPQPSCMQTLGPRRIIPSDFSGTSLLEKYGFRGEVFTA